MSKLPVSSWRTAIASCSTWTASTSASSAGGLGKRHRARSGLEVEDPRRIQGVAVRAHHQLFVDRREFSDVHEAAEPAARDDIAEIQVTFGPDEIVGGHQHRTVGRLLCVHPRSGYARDYRAV